MSEKVPEMLEVIKVDDNARWDAVVRSFPTHDVYWLNGYVKAFQIHGDGEPLLFHYEDSKVRGINVVMKRDIAHDSHFMGTLQEDSFFDFSTPYGYGGWIIEGGDSVNLFSAYENWARNHNVVSEFVRFHPMLKNHNCCVNAYEVIQHGKVVHMDICNPDNIWQNITSKNRNVIRKALKNNIKIYNGRYPDIFNIFKSIYNSTMDKDAADTYYYFENEFYKSVLEDLSDNAQVFWAEKDGIVIAASIMLECNGYMNYHLSGSLREYSSLAPTNLLLYRAALWGCAHGLRTLYLGGGLGSREDGLFKFKKSFFKGELNSFYTGRIIFDDERYQHLLSLRADEAISEGFFPQYRA